MWAVFAAIIILGSLNDCIYNIIFLTNSILYSNVDYIHVYSINRRRELLMQRKISSTFLRTQASLTNS